MDENLLNIMLYKIQKTDIKKAAQVLGKSFSDYPLFKFILSDNRDKNEKLNHIFNFIIKYGIIKGSVYAPTSNIEGVSIWINHSENKSSVMDFFQAGIITLGLRVDVKTLKRFNQIGLYKQKKRSDIIKNPYYLLDVIGVDPQFTKQGFATLLINTKLDEIDKKKIPCYLETSNKKNILFYQRFGFIPVQDYEFMTVKIYCLYRNPIK